MKATRGVRVNPRNATVLYPIEPLRAWLDRLVADDERDHGPWAPPGPNRWAGFVGMAPEARVAMRLGISPEQMRKLRKSRKWVSERTVDAICANEGSIHPAELYPAYWDIAEAGGPRELVNRNRNAIEQEAA